MLLYLQISYCRIRYGSTFMFLNTFLFLKGPALPRNWNVAWPVSPVWRRRVALPGMTGSIRLSRCSPHGSLVGSRHCCRPTRTSPCFPCKAFRAFKSCHQASQGLTLGEHAVRPASTVQRCQGEVHVEFGTLRTLTCADCASLL